jgi:hypothetical protein
MRRPGRMLYVTATKTEYRQEEGRKKISPTAFRTGYYGMAAGPCVKLLEKMAE